MSVAPEMAVGKTEIDGRVDIYCLGCVGYWLLTGQRVFVRDNALATVVAHVQEQPTPPSERTELEVSAALERVILACLEKDPANRPQSAGELDAMLGACKTEDQWDTRQAREWWDLHASEADTWGETDSTEDRGPEAIVRAKE